MKFILMLTVLLSLCFIQVQSQVPVIKWSNVFSSTSLYPNPTNGIDDVKPTSNGELIMVGSESSDYYINYTTLSFVSNNYGSSGKPYIMKTDKNGNLIWKKYTNSIEFGGSFSSVIETNDGGFIAVGSVSEPYPYSQVLIVKFDSNGIQKWLKKYGGSNSDQAYSICKTKTTGYIVLGTSSSTDGDVIGNHSSVGDFWVIRIDEDGNIIWNKCYGGSETESGKSVIQSRGYGFILAGRAESNNGDLTNSFGLEDGWIVEIDSIGNIIWQKSFGTDNYEHFQDIVQSSDGTITATGSQNSYSDVWVLKMSATGNLIWSKNFNGTLVDDGIDIELLPDQNYLVTSLSSYYGMYGNGHNGGADGWILKIDQNGNLLWNKFIGGPNAEILLRSVHFPNGDIISVGRTHSQLMRGRYYPRGLLVCLGNSNKLKGTLFLDANSNGTKDAGEVNFNNALIKSQKGISSTSAQPQNGQFFFDIDTGAYTTTVQLFNPYYNVVPSSRNTNFSTYFNVDSFGFAIQPIPNKQDLQINFTPLSPVRPGFKAQYALNYKNVGTTTITSGSVKLIKDSRATLSAALPVPSSIVADTLTWNYTNLKPLDSIAIGIEFQLASPPALNINDTLKYLAVILPVAGDLTPADDTSSLRQRVQGSFDPNDKQESFAGKIPLKSVQDGSYINYVIRFQNTGNDTAFFVRLLDTLDSKLDWSSFQMIGSSHAYNLTIKDGNKLNWFFDNIKLPDSTTNLAKSIGYVAFRIKPKNTLVANEVISNKASIYFDYNLPIVTNTTNTVVSVETTTAIREVQNDEMKMKLGPNPSNGYSVLQISGKLKGKFELRIIDANGRIISQQTITRNSTGEIIQLPLNLQQLASGVYIIQLQQKEKSWWQKIVLQ
jgi:hypothetical protein